MKNGPASQPAAWEAYRDLFAEVQRARKWSRAQLVDALKRDAMVRGMPKCTYDKRSTEYWEAEPKPGGPCRKPRRYRLEHLYQWFSAEIKNIGKTAEYAARLHAIAPAPRTPLPVQSTDAETVPAHKPGITGIQPLAEFQGDARELDEAVRAYKEVDWDVANHYLTEYYLSRGVDVFGYLRPGAPPIRVSLLEPWKGVQTVETTFDDRLVQPQRAAVEAKYEKIVPELRQGLGLTDPRKWNDPVFRLMKVIEQGPNLTFSFERTDFFTALVTQYCLEYELVLAMDRHRRKETSQIELPHRDATAGDTAKILRFWETRPCRIGVSNLFLLRMGDDEYLPLLGERSRTSMTNVAKALSKTKVKQFDTASSGILDIHSAYPKEFDKNVPHKVFTEIGEEVFGRKRWAKTLLKPYQGPLMPDWFYTRPRGKKCMLELVALLKRKAAVFCVTGVCIDLVRIVPEITTLTLIKDKSYFEKYHTHFKPSKKYPEHERFMHKLRLPVKVKDFDRFITQEIWSDPDNQEGKRGFDPQYYTLPGGYCLYQGLKRAVEIGLR